MERLLLAAVGTILIATSATPPALANKTAANLNVTQNQVQKNITPFNLVSFAYRGEFKPQGVSGYNSLLTAIRFGEVSGKDLVKLGVDTGRLSAQTINDDSYINAVNSQLQELSRN
ncbi:hypothetical protein Riv7116_4418 [Rivularia sp. PCC 7116]|uniref:hypothetical protein n=1 Tax=Rivularia sp. PCC 7116 TaxID=373994 RepID=UPI00029F0FBF|nr:hypothetical protein [Rivularia sp. PCC 7116]AFY56839.1 hypothetical protein Riv7116_4418 [Rivularia sp. PCC 7116]